MKSRPGHASISADDVPVRTSLDVRQLSLGRVEGYVLSCIDGRSSVEDLCVVTGLSGGEVHQVVARLIELGAIHVGARPQEDDEPTGRSALPPPVPSLESGPPIPVDWVPQPTNAVHTGLSIGAEEAFVLSQIDGTTRLSDLASIAGMDVNGLSAVLRKLESKGAIELNPAPRRAKERATVSVDVFSTPRDRRRPGTVRPPRASEGRERRSKPPDEPRPLRERQSRLPPGRKSQLPPGRRSQLPPAGRKSTVPASRKSQAPPSTRRSQVPPSTRKSQAPPSTRKSQAPSSTRKSQVPGGRRSRLPPVNRSGERKSNVPSTRASKLSSAVRAPAVDDETCELDAALQARILELHGKLAASHYDVLGVARDADKASLKRVYFGFVATIHPDRHFKKKLGPFKRKLEEVFVRLTRAYDTLSDASARAAYDLTLPAPLPVLPPFPSMPSVVEPSIPPMSSPMASRRRIRISTSRFRAVEGRVRIDEESRRDPPISLSTPGVPASGPVPVSGTVPTSGKTESARDRARVFVEAAEQALARGNVGAAAAQFQLAFEVSGAPEHRKAFEALRKVTKG